MNKFFRFNQKFSIRIPFIITFFILSIISILTLNFASNFESSIFGFSLSRSERQMIWLALGVIIFFLFQFLRLRLLNEKIYSLYLITIFLLSLPFFADSVKGARNWIFGFQPSEFGKVIIVIALAKFLSDNKKNINNIYYIIISALIILIPTLIFFAQKDIGTALVYFSILIPMLYWIGLSPKYCFLIFSPIAVGYINMTFNVYDYYNIDSLYPIFILIIWLFINFIFLIKNNKKTFTMVSSIISIVFINIFFTIVSNYS